MASDDLGQLTIGALIEDLGRAERYGAHPRALLLRKELTRRGHDCTDLFPTPPPRPALRLRPLADHVVVLPTEAEAVTEGGIIVPDTAKEKPMQGEVLAVGDGRIEPGIGTILPTVAVGQVVLFGRYAGTAVELDGLKCLILREEEILGILAPPVTA